MKGALILILKLGLAGALVGVGGLTAASYLGQYHWRLDLLSHFRIQYLQILLLLLVSGAFILRKKALVLFLGLGLVFAALSAASMSPYYLPVHAKPSAQSLTLLNLNVWVTNRNDKAVAKVIEEKDADILTLNEYNHWWKQALKQLGVLKRYPYQFVDPWGDNAIYSKFPIQNASVSIFGPSKNLNQNPKAIVATITYGGKPLKLVLVHPKPPTRRAWAIHHRLFFQELADFLKDSNNPQIVAGDLNSAPWGQTVQAFIQKTRLKDSQLGHGIQPSWSTHRPYLMIPIDHVLVSQNFTVRKREVGPNVGSDHLPVYVELGLPED